MDPVGQQELDAADQQAHPGHDRIAEGGPESDHHEPDADLGRDPQGPFVLPGEEEIGDGADDAHQDQQAHQQSLVRIEDILQHARMDHGALDLLDDVGFDGGRQAHALAHAQQDGDGDEHQPSQFGHEAEQIEQPDGQGDEHHPVMGQEDIADDVIRDDPLPVIGHHVAHRHAGEEMFGETVDRILLVEEGEDGQGQYGRKPDPGIGRHLRLPPASVSYP